MPASPDHAQTAGSAPRYPDRLLADAVRAYEELGGAVTGDAEATNAAIQRDGDLEDRLVERARRLGEAADLRAALGQVRRLIATAVVVGLVLALLAGFAAGRAALGLRAGEPVNFFWALGGLLGVQTLLLVLWLVTLVIVPRGLASGSLGAVLAAAGRKLAARVQRSRLHQAALAAVAQAQARRGLATWSFSSLSHGLWLAFNVGCFVALIALLSTRQYAFSWETTILSEEAYQRFAQTLAVAPSRLGFDTPSPEQIAASRSETAAEADRATQRQWGHLLLGSVLVYALLPRLVLLLLCGSAYALARSRFRLDLDQPGYQRLRSRLLAEETYLGVVPYDDAAAGSQTASGTVSERSPRPHGEPAIVALEVDMPTKAWRPRQWLDGGVEDLGVVDDSASRRGVLEHLRGSDAEPGPLLIVCDLTVTPDRGTTSFLRSLRESIATPVHVVLTGGERLRRRSAIEAVGRRIDDWRHCLSEAGVEAQHVREIDLEHLTDESRRLLGQIVEAEREEGDAPDAMDGAAGPALTDTLAAAFDLIGARALDWEERDAAPDWKEQAKLHEAIARLYDSRDRAWRQRWLPRQFEKPSLDELRGLVQDRSSAMLALLPPRLKNNPKWLAAGAAAGGLACITAGVFASPLAFAALPSWSIVGAAIAGVTHLARTGTDAKAEPGREPVEHDFAQAVRSAVLFTLTLQLQGRGEARIAEALDRCVPEDDAPLTTSDEVERSLEEARRRFAAYESEGGHG
jgi:hypothetical protein